MVLRKRYKYIQVPSKIFWEGTGFSVQYKTKKVELEKGEMDTSKTFYKSDEYKQKQRDSKKKIWSDPNSKYNSSEYKEKQSEGTKKQWDKAKLKNKTSL